MGLIKIHSPRKKPANKKPGWREAEAQQAAWLKSINSMRLFPNRSSPKSAVKKPVQVVTATPVHREDALSRPPSLNSFGGAGTKPVHRPDIMYKDDPEMLERELKARERKFNVAPAYNKGPTIYVSEEDITSQLVGGRRR